MNRGRPFERRSEKEGGKSMDTRIKSGYDRKVGWIPGSSPGMTSKRKAWIPGLPIPQCNGGTSPGMTERKMDTGVTYPVIQ